MKLANLLAAFVVVSVPVSVMAQAHLPSIKDHLKVHKNRLPQPSHDLYKVHSRRLAFDQKNGRHQFRVLNHKQQHTFHKDVRGVAHHATAPHHP